MFDWVTAKDTYAINRYTSIIPTNTADEIKKSLTPPTFIKKSIEKNDELAISGPEAFPNIRPVMNIGPANGSGFKQHTGTMQTKNTIMFITAAMEVFLQQELMKTPSDDAVRALSMKSTASGINANGWMHRKTVKTSRWPAIRSQKGQAFMTDAIILPLAMSLLSSEVERSIGQVRASFSEVMLEADITAVLKRAKNKYTSMKATCIDGSK